MKACLRDVDSLDADNPEGGTQGGEGSGGLAREAEEQIRSADRDERLTNSACYLSPDTCQQGDRPTKRCRTRSPRWSRERWRRVVPTAAQRVFAAAQGRPFWPARPRDGGGDASGRRPGSPPKVATQQDGQGIPALAAVPVAPGRLGGAKRIASGADPYR